VQARLDLWLGIAAKAVRAVAFVGSADGVPQHAHELEIQPGDDQI